MTKRIALTSFAVAICAWSANTTGAKNVTFSKDVAPILFNRCVECHRAGEAAPMQLITYKEVRPWAKAIKSSVVQRRMPVWLADPSHGQFRNERKLSQGEIDTISAWVDAGAPEGDSRDLPKPPEFVTGWSIGKPDQTFELGEEFEVPAEGVIPYKYFRVATNFTEDMWVERAEIRPGDRPRVHHVIVFIEEPGKPSRGTTGNLLTGFAPGEQALIFEPGVAKKVPAGSTLIFQMHYTTNGTAGKDRTMVGLKYAKNPPKFQAITGNALNFGFKIPPGDPNYEVKSSFTAKRDLEIIGFMPHMHVRGKDFKYTIVHPDGREEVVLSVPRYDFNWQLAYETAQPLRLAEGAKINCVAHFDNSANNKYNPDPTKEVKWGDQTWEEMMIGWFTYKIPVESKTETKPAPTTGE